jgi:hypothetical protein
MGHLVGSIGEVAAAGEFDLDLHKSPYPNHDAKDKRCRDVQIETTAGDGNPVWQAAGKPKKNGQRTSIVATLQKLLHKGDLAALSSDL